MPIKKMPSKLDFYILGEVVGPFLGGVIFFCFIFLMFQVLRLADYIIMHNVPGFVLLKMTSYLMVTFLPTALPVAFLIAVLVAFGRLSADSELVAMKASGVSIYRLTVPVALFSVLVVVLSLALNLEWVPQSQRNFKTTLIRVGNTKIVSAIHEGTFTTGFFDLLVYADKVDSKTNQLEGVFIYDEREPKNPLAVVSKRGQIVRSANASAEELGGSAFLVLQEGNIHRNDLDTGTYQKIDFGQYRLFLKINEGEDNSFEKPRFLSYFDLRERLGVTPPSDPKLVEYKNEFWRRVMDALSPLLFVFLGVGFGTARTRTVRAGAFLTATVVVVIYWGLQTTGVILSQKQLVFPWVGASVPLLALLAPTMWSFKKSSW